MYDRENSWQTPIISSQSEVDWENEIYLGFPCVDLRFKLYGYGWKDSSDTQNMTVLYPGRYELYYKVVGEDNWTYWQTVVSERNDQQDTTVYRHIFVTLGEMPENTYAVKIVAADGEKYASWTNGVIEGISEDDEFWYDFKILGVKANIPLPYENVVISEFLQIGVNLISIDVNDSIQVSEEPINYVVVILFSDILYDNATVYENVEVLVGWPAFAYDTVTVTEDVSVVFPILLVNVGDSIGIIEAPMGQEPPNELFVLDHQYVSEYFEHGMVEVLVTAEDVTASESVDLYLDVLVPNIYTEPSVTEAVELNMTIDIPYAYDEASVQEDIEAHPDNLFTNIYEDISIQENVSKEKVYLIDVYDEVSSTENTQSMVVILVNVYDDISVQEDAEVVSISQVNVYESVSLEENIQGDVITLINVYEDISVQENKEIILIYLCEIYDEVSVTESKDISLDSLVPDVYDEISYTEDFEYLLINVIIEYDDISVIEDFTPYVEININKFETISTTEVLTEFYVNPLSIDKYESVDTSQIDFGAGGALLLLHLDNNTTDETGRHNSPTTDNTVFTSADYKWGGYCAEYNDTDRQLKFGSGNDWKIVDSMSDDYTISFWIKSDAPEGSYGIMENFKTSGGIPGNTEYWFVEMYVSAISTRQIDFGVQSSVVGSGWTVRMQGATFIADTWTHVAIVKKASSWGIYINGEQKAHDTQIRTQNYNSTMTFGYASQGGGWFDGYLDEILFYDGNLYNVDPQAYPNYDSFEPPKYPFGGDGAIVALDPLLPSLCYDTISIAEDFEYIGLLLIDEYESFTVAEDIDVSTPFYEIDVYDSISNPGFPSSYTLLLHAENNVTDSSPNAYTPSNYDVAFIGGGYKKWGDYAFNFQANDYIEYGYSFYNANRFLNSLTDDWTFDLWYKAGNATFQNQIFIQGGGGEVFYLTRRGSPNYDLYAMAYNPTTIIQLYGGTINDTNYHHIALIKVGSDWGIYIDGNQVAYDSQSITYYMAQNFVIRSSNESYNCQMDEFRIVHDNPFNASPNSGNTDVISVPGGAYEPDYDIIDISIQTPVTDFSVYDSVTANTDVNLGVV